MKKNILKLMYRPKTVKDIAVALELAFSLNVIKTEEVFINAIESRGYFILRDLKFTNNLECEQKGKDGIYLKFETVNIMFSFICRLLKIEVKLDEKVIDYKKEEFRGKQITSSYLYDKMHDLFDEVLGVEEGNLDEMYDKATEFIKCYEDHEQIETEINELYKEINERIA